jgi:hypothetical protein
MPVSSNEIWRRVALAVVPVLSGICLVGSLPFVALGVTGLAGDLADTSRRENIEAGLFLLAIGAILAALGIVTGAWVYSVQRRRRPPGICPTCGYDLRHRGQGRACPECGSLDLNTRR